MDISLDIVIFVFGLSFVVLGIRKETTIPYTRIVIKLEKLIVRVVVSVLGIAMILLVIYLDFVPKLCDVFGEEVTITKPVGMETLKGEVIDGTKLYKATMTISGDYKYLKEDIWVIVWPDGTDLGYPQTTNQAEGKPAIKANGRWTVNCNLQTSKDQKFQIVVYRAKGEASKMISDKLKESFRNGDSAYLKINDLPEGLKEMGRITVDVEVP